jgi:hypothetical protein
MTRDAHSRACEEPMTTSPRLWIVTAVVLLGLGVAIDAQVRQVNVATNATDPNDLGDTEPSIAVNPLNHQQIAIVTFSERWVGTQNAPVWKSDDGGLTWRKVMQIPRPVAGITGPGDQKIAFDANGRLHIAELGRNMGVLQAFIFRQTGAADAALTAGAAYGDDQPMLDIDVAAAGPCAGRLYSAFLNFGVALERSSAAHSVNAGAAMNAVGVGDNATFRNRTSRTAISPNGRVYLIYKTREGAVGAEPNAFQNAHFRVARSDDCGATWNGTGAGGVSVHGAAAVATFFTNQFGNPAGGRLVARARSSDAWIAADPSDADVYAAFVSRDGSGFGQIFVARSTDQGVTWTQSRVTDGTHHSAYPEIAVAANGAVGVLYVDFEDTGTVTNYRHRFARSFDNGVTWIDQTLQSANMQGLAGADDEFLWGDYEGLTAAGNTFFGAYTGRSTGRTTAQLDPIFFRDSAFAVPPKIHVTSPLVFPNSCGTAPVTTTMNVCNTGGGSLTVFPITSTSPNFVVGAPTGGFPLTVAAGSCFAFPVTFTPVGPGPASATLTIPSDDPANLTVSVTAQANVGQATAVTVIPDAGHFGDVCPLSTKFHDVDVTINNSGTCPLVVTSMSLSLTEFQSPQVLNFPLTVAPGASIAVPFRFKPTSPGLKVATVTLATNDPSAPTKSVKITGTAPEEYVCTPPVYSAIDASVGPTFGNGRTGDYTYNGAGGVLKPFGVNNTFGVQLQGEYLFYPGRQEGQFDSALLYRRGVLQFGVGGSFKAANLRAEASTGSLSHATLTFDVLTPFVRFGAFGSKGLRETHVVTLSQSLGSPPGIGQPIVATERVLHTIDQLGGAVQVELMPDLWVDGNLAWLHRHAPGVSDTVGAAARFSVLVAPNIVFTARFDLNESFVGPDPVGTVTFGVTLGRWSRPRDYSNPQNPLGVLLPRVRFEQFVRDR